MQNWKRGERRERDRERLQCCHCSCRQWDTARANIHSRTHTQLSAKNHRSILTILNPFHSICKSAGRVLAYSRANVSSLGDLSRSLLSLSLSLYVSQRWRGSVRPAGERVGIPPPSEAACECTGFGMSWTLQPHSLPPPHWWGQSSPLLLTSLTGCLSCPSSALLWKINTFALAALQTKAQALQLAEALSEPAKAINCNRGLSLS